MKMKRNAASPRRQARRALRRELEWTARYVVEGSRDRGWRECRILDISREGAGVELFDATSEEARTHRIVLELEVTPAVLRLAGDVRHVRPGMNGGVHVGLHFTGLSVLEQDLLGSILEPESRLR
jgi:PilZ domain